MKSPIGGTSWAADSMRTSGWQPKEKPKLTWKLYRDAAGTIQFRRYKEGKVEKAPTGPAVIDATIPRKVAEDDERMRDLMASIEIEGGTVLSSRGRIMSLSVGEGTPEAIGDVLDSFGCQWDVQK